MRRTIAIFFAVSFLTVPFAAANWTYRGNNEPDTAHDDETWMFFDTNTDPSSGVNKIYFNGFGRIARETHYNPNVGALGTRVQPAITAMSAILGFWKDCNDDGYIGLAETAALEYREELLLNKNICPERTPTVGQSIYPHNDGDWIRELIWIGPTLDDGVIGAPSGNPTNFYAKGTGVWADWGLPGARPVLVCPGGNVGIRSTGTVLEYVDCNTYFKTVRTLNEVDPNGNTVGGWETHDIDNSDTPLNVDNPVYPYLYGPPEPDGHAQEGDYRGYSGGILGRDSDNDNQRQRMITVVDCSANNGAGGLDPTPEVNTPSDPFDPATYPSLYESINDTWEVYVQPDENYGCAASGPSDEGAPYPHVEGYSEPTFADHGRVEVDHPHEFSAGSRGFPTSAVAGTCRGGNNPSFNPGPLGYCPPADLGLAAERDDFAIGPAWRTNAQINTYSMTTREQGLQDDSPDFGGWHMTWYASVGDAARLFNSGAWPGNTAKYGAEVCGTATSGIIGGWNCSEQAWINRCNDPTLETLPAQCYRVHRAYHMRDIDCWDNTLVRGAGIRAGLSDLSASGPCIGHPSNDDIDLPLS